MKTINIGIVGFGTVGTGVVKILRRSAVLIKKRTGIVLNLKRIADIDLKKKREVSVPEGILTSDFKDVIYDPEIDIVVELIGGCGHALDVIIQSLKQGKIVVTANKALLAERGREIFGIAEQYGADIYYEASVAGSIPIIKVLREGFVANRINSILGIVNGTSNYILSRMSSEGIGFKEALEEAKIKGYVEANPKLDVEGIDSAHKLAILASLAMGRWIDLEKIYTEGITYITDEDIMYAKKFGYVIKLLAIAKEERDEIETRVHPALLRKEHELSSVSGVYNAVFVTGSNIGNALFYGQGAGQLPAGSAVLADIVDAARIISFGIKYKWPIIASVGEVKKIRPMEKVLTQNYLKFTVMDRPGVLAKIAGILGKYKISIESVIQIARHKVNAVPVVMMTHKAMEIDMRRALAETDRLPEVRKKTVRIRVEE